MFESTEDPNELQWDLEKSEIHFEELLCKCIRNDNGIYQREVPTIVSHKILINISIIIKYSKESLKSEFFATIDLLITENRTRCGERQLELYEAFVELLDATN